MKRDIHDDLDVRIGGRILAARKTRGMTQGALGKRLGVTFQQVQKYENGNNRVSASTLARIAGILGLPIASFFDPIEADQPAGDASEKIVPAAVRVAATLDRIPQARLRRTLDALISQLAGPEKMERP